MGASPPPLRPSRAAVAALYDRGVDGYVNLWSAVILPAAQAVVAAMDMAPDATVVDVGAGTGAVVPALRAASPHGHVVALDPSAQMLRVAQERTDAFVAMADALALPVRGDSADAVLFAFVLFHTEDPAAALGEAARVLRPGGTVGTATWAASSEVSPPAYAVWDAALTEGGAPPISGGRVDSGLDSPGAMRDLLADNDFVPTKIWVEKLSQQWTADTYFQLATGSGMNRVRLDVLDDQARTSTLELAHQRLASLAPEELLWSGDVVCAVATV